MSAISGFGASGATSTGNAYSAMTSGDFMKIIFTELTNQDPLAPSDTKDLLNQFATIRSIESNTALSDRMNDIAHQNEITSSSSLVGKFITGKTSSGAETAGYVDSVSITRDGTILNLSSNTRVPLKNLTEIIDPELLKGAADNVAPSVNTVIPDQVATRGSAWTFTVPRTTFNDEDVDSLKYTATLDDGNALPEWVKFNTASRVLSGTPGADDTSPIKVKITAADGFNLRTSTAFTLTLNTPTATP